MKTKNKLLLAALAVAVTLLAPTSARAGTGWARGGNWADVQANITGMHFWTGISNSTTMTQATNVTDQVVKDFASVGINFVRVAINPATVASTNWPILKACINELTAKGMTVDIGCWYCWPLDSTGVITNMTLWQNMWQTVDNVYSNNNSVYFEPINEPAGYSLAGLESVYTTYLGFIHKSQSHIILDGTGFSADVTGIGGDSAFNSCLLSLHIYPGWGGNTSEAQYENYLVNTVVKSYFGRTIITEIGATTVNGKNYTQANNADNEISLIRGVGAQCRTWGMGFVYWPANIPVTSIGTIDGRTMYTKVGGAITNASLVSELQYGWNNTGSPHARADFIGDGMDDYVFFHTNDATWHVTYAGGLATNSFQWGAAGDIPLVDGDWDGSGIASAVVWRPSNATWYIRSGINGNELGPIQWGATGDIPLLGGDYDGDGAPDPVVWRPSNNTWYVWSTKNSRELTSFAWGQSGDIPLLNGDFDGDGAPDATIFRPSNNTWYIWSSKTASELESFQFGTNGCVPVLGGDYDNDGIPDAQYFDPATGTWHVRFSGGTNQTRSFSWGTSGDIPFTGYITSDHALDQNVYRPSTGVFYVRNGTTGATSSVPTSATSTDIPVH
jgi:hypothetical protein